MRKGRRLEADPTGSLTSSSTRAKAPYGPVRLSMSAVCCPMVGSLKPLPGSHIAPWWVRYKPLPGSHIASWWARYKPLPGSHIASWWARYKPLPGFGALLASYHVCHVGIAALSCSLRAGYVIHVPGRALRPGRCAGGVPGGVIGEGRIAADMRDSG